MTRRTGRPPGLTPDGTKIRSLRVDKGLTARELATQIRVHPDSIGQWEKGRPISDVYASRLARALGVTVGDIASPASVAA
jgi:transcriptional regulator with XRE-family HTH domain